MRTLNPGVVLALMLAAWPQASASAGGEPRSLAVPAGPEAYGPRLTTGAGGVVLSWMEPDGETAALRYSRLVDGTWQPARTVIENADLFVNWADLPSVVAFSDSHWAAHWLEMSGPYTYSYDVRVVQSHDGGATWSEPVAPHRDRTPTEHGFVSLYAHGDMVGVLWLDGRETLGPDGRPEHGSGMTLRAARIDDRGGLHDEQVVDDLVCDCCQTDVATAHTGPVAVYRDRTYDEIRDIHLTRTASMHWESDAAVHADGWEIAGCPVNGPSIAAQGRDVAVAWFTAPGNVPAVRLKRSKDGGMTFSEAVDIDTEGALGHADVVALPDGSTVVSWLSSTDGGLAALNVRRASAEDDAGYARTIATSVQARSVPQMGLDDDQLVFVWTERNGDRFVLRSARLPAESLGD